jgi:hypothetical protein
MYTRLGLVCSVRGRSEGLQTRVYLGTRFALQLRARQQGGIRLRLVQALRFRPHWRKG